MKTAGLLSWVRQRRGRFALVAGAGVVIAAIALWTTRGNDRPRGQVRPEALTRSDDTAGMNMTADGSVQLTAAQVREFGITFATVDVRNVSGELRTVGTVVVDETRTASITIKVSGFVERLYVDFTGQPIRRGQPLFEIYSPDVLATQEELLLATRLENSVQSDIPGVPRGSVDLKAAAQQRLRLWDVSEAQIDEIIRTGKARRTVTVFSPSSGVVLEKNVVAGQSVQPGDVLYRVGDLSRVWVEAQVREADAASIATGVRATIELPGRTLSGTVEYLYPTLDVEARSLRARISLANPGGILRPGTYAGVRLSVPGRMALSVPSSAIVNTGERSVVFVDYGGGKIVPQQVAPGSVGGEYTEILSGLEPGQRVVTSAHFLLDSESNLAEVMRSMISQGAAGMESTRLRATPDTGADMPGMTMPPAKR
ncbi:MAG: efflux RND transporter periplasmic adaptor subunit [Gemmatimonadota bacterium]